jgi:hypothetical protein
MLSAPAAAARDIASGALGRFDSRHFFMVWAALLVALVPAQAQAAPEEIQVYMDELNAAGEPGLDVHVNDVLQAVPGPAFPGGEPSLHRWRVTPEFSLGLGDGFEAGAYLPMATIAPDGKLRADGVKLRMKWLAPHGAEGFFWGANYEVGYSDHFIDTHHWNNEIKLIGGWRNEHWLAAINANVDFALSGPNPGPATVEFDEKVGYKISKRLTLGVETYNGFGPLHALGQFSVSDQSTFLTADAHIGAWDVNAGIGKGYGGNIDHLILKFIISVPLTRSH